MINNHLPKTREVKDIQFQMHYGKFFAVLLIGGLSVKEKKEKQSINTLGQKQNIDSESNTLF